MKEILFYQRPLSHLRTEWRRHISEDNDLPLVLKSTTSSQGDHKSRFYITKVYYTQTITFAAVEFVAKRNTNS